MIKLIASDLDGTLLTDSKELSQTTVQILDMAVKKGIYVIPATGRSFRAIPEWIRNYPGIRYVITSNGGAIYSVLENKRIYQCLLNGQTVEEALDIQVPENTAIELFVDGIPYSEESYVRFPEKYGATEYGAKYVRETRIPVKDIKAFAMEHRTELDSMAFICGDRAGKCTLEKQLRDSLSDAYITSSVPHMVEIGHKNAGKGNTLLYLMRLLGISPDEAIAFGDADNDCSMLEAVKYGVAVGNATEACKKAAAFVTASNEEDGVAKAVRQFLQKA